MEIIFIWCFIEMEKKVYFTELSTKRVANFLLNKHPGGYTSLKNIPLVCSPRDPTLHLMLIELHAPLLSNFCLSPI